jgi:hypothetical protein
MIKVIFIIIYLVDEDNFVFEKIRKRIFRICRNCRWKIISNLSAGCIEQGLSN